MASGGDGPARHNNCLNSRAVIAYVEAEKPEAVSDLLADLGAELAGVKEPRSYLSDPNNWISSSLLATLYDRAKSLLNDPEAARKIGHHSVMESRLGYVQKILLLSLGNPKQAVKRVQQVSDHLNRTKWIEIAQLGDTTATIRLHWDRGIPLSEDFCLMNKGVFEAIPTIWKLPPAKIVETRCFFKGDECCEYNMSWTRGRINHWIRRFFTPWRLVRSAIEELEQDKKVLRGKYDEVAALNASLSEKVEQLLSLQETSTAILSTLKFEDLLDLILNRLIHVAHLDRAGIFLLDDHLENLIFIHAVGIDKAALDKLKNYSIPLKKEDNIIARSAKEGQPVFIEDVEKTPLNPDNPLLMTFKPKAFILVPLKVRNQTVGILVGDSRKGERAMKDIDREFLSSFANHIAMALENACLYRRIQESEQIHREIVENSQEGIWIVDDGGSIIFANQSFSGRLGHDSLTGLNLYSLADERDKKTILDLMRENMKGRPSSGELRLKGKDGGILSVLMSAVPMQTSGMKAENLVMVTDITERKQMEAKLLQSQKLETIGTMAGGIAHDFNNILTGILGYTQLIKAKLDQGSSLQRYADVIEQSSMRAADLVRQLLTFSRGMKPDDSGPVSLNAVATETAKLVERSLPKTIGLVLRLSDDVPPVTGNQTQLQQALLNLVINARDAMPEGGTVTMTTRCADSEELVHRCRACEARPGPYAVISVEDTGSGIAPEHLTRIFDPFFTTKGLGKGTGLGLAMVYGIVKNSNGHILVESKPGAGTSFDLFFPALEGGADEAREADTATELFTGTETVLVVDDEEMVRDLAGEILGAHGYRVIKASDGIEALHTVKALGPSIDLILMDLAMPRLDGINAYERIREEIPGQKVLFMSGYTSQVESVEKLKKAGSLFLSKPFKEDDLLKKVREAINSPL